MTTNIFLIAGEASGDVLGAKLMMAMKNENDDIKFFGVGGPKMTKQGLESLFPMSELSLLGFAEIIPHIPHLLKRIDETVSYIEQTKPEIVVTIDAPAFNFRVAKKLKESGSEVKRVHYVAPSVWAYKPKRAEKISKLYDHLLTLLPFEPPYFEKAGLPTTFVGHSILEDDLKDGNGESFKQKHGIYKKAETIYMMPGSRRSEIKRLLPIFVETISILRETNDKIYPIIMAVKDFEKEIKAEFDKLGIQFTIVTDPNEKKHALAASMVGLAKSGTGTLELSIAGVPMVVTYKVNPISAWTLRKMIQVQYVNIINLLLDAPVIPELLQEDCNPEYLAAALSALLNDNDARQNQLINAQKAVHMLYADGIPSPSKKAANTILGLITQTADT